MWTTIERALCVLVALACLMPRPAAAAPGCRRECNETQRLCKNAVRAELAALQALCPAADPARRQCRHDARIAVEPHGDACRAEGRACRACCKSGVEPCGPSTTTTSTTTTTSSSTTSSTSPETTCGDGLVEAGEACDPAASPNGCFAGTPYCRDDCTACGATCTKLVFTAGAPTADCGFPGQLVGAVPPLSGELLDQNGMPVPEGQLGLGCLYLGGGLASIVPPSPMPAGEETLLDVVDCGVDDLELRPADTGNAHNCTVGPLSTRHCVNGHPGTDGQAACTGDTDCRPVCVAGHCIDGALGLDGAGTCSMDAHCGVSAATGPPEGVCLPDASCFFGAPQPIDNGGTSLCMLNAVGDGVAGVADVTTGGMSLAMPLRAQLYLTGLEPAFSMGDPCPICVGGVCNAGARAGQACTAATAGGTTIDCPPPAHLFLSALDVTLSPLVTGAVQAQDDAGLFCPSQHFAGAFGRSEVRRIVEVGSPAAGGLGADARSATLAAIECIPATGNLLIDAASDLPGPAAVSLGGTLQLR